MKLQKKRENNLTFFILILELLVRVAQPMKCFDFENIAFITVMLNPVFTKSAPQTSEQLKASLLSWEVFSNQNITTDQAN